MEEVIGKAVSQFDTDGITRISWAEQAGLNTSSWFICGRYVLKAFTDTDILNKVLCTNAHMRQAGVPVAKYCRTKTGERYACVDGVFYTLAEKSAGLPAEPYSEGCLERAYSVGVYMAALHAALKPLDAVLRLNDFDSMDDLRRVILPDISHMGLTIGTDIIDYCLGFAGSYNRLPRQVIHRDLHPGNLLFENNKLTAFIDFDICQINARLFDLCYYGSTFLFEADPEQREKWFDIFTRFLFGYNTVSDIIGDEYESMPQMLVHVPLLFIHFWLNKGQTDEVEKGVEWLNWSFENRNRFCFN